MRRTCFIFSMVVLVFGFADAQKAPYRVVFDLTSRDSLDQLALTRWVNEIAGANPEAELEVVMYGKGFELVMPERSKVLEGVRSALKKSNIAFRVCAMALKHNKIETNQLEPGVQTVPDGVYEIVSKQHEGWAYIKVSH
jgi:intracellular sulfur oxidation DsrE/DsrF family protein